MDSEETQELGLTIDGKVYPVVSVWEFDGYEDQILWDEAKVAKVDFVPYPANTPDREKLEEERRRRILHPGVNRTYLHVAYRRGNPDVSDAEIRELVWATKVPEAMATMSGDDADPPAQSVETRTPSEASPSEPSLTDSSLTPKPESSAKSSPNGSDASDRTPASTGHGR